jgi:hypothetical protein
MSSLSAKDRVSLCMFSFADGRRCRTPRLRNHPYFCYDHAEKEARARAAQSLGTDLARYFSGQYLSACDLSTALGCLIPAVVRGDVKPKVARTVAYMAQTLLQSIHISQHEYCQAFGADAWRNSIHNSVHGNHKYRFPFTPSKAEGPDPHRSGDRKSSRSEIPTPSGPGRDAGVPLQPQPAAPTSPACHPERSEGSQLIPSTKHSPVAQAACPEGTRRVRGETSRSSAAAQTQSQQQLASSPAQTPVNCHSERSEESAFSSSSAAPQTQPQQPAPSRHTPMPPTSTEFAQHVLAGLPRSVRPGSTGETVEGQAPQLAPGPSSQPAEPPSGRHCERSESVFSPSPAQQQTQAQQPVSAMPANHTQPATVPQPFTSAALPLPLRRHLNSLNGTTTPEQASPLESTFTRPTRNC